MRLFNMQMFAELKSYPVGACAVYRTVVDSTGDTITIPADEVIETDANLAGRTQGGAKLNYEPTFETFEDDLGYIMDKYLTEEDASVEFSLMTWNAETLKDYVSTALFSETDTTRTVDIGGLSNYEDKVFIFRLVHTFKDGRKLRITLAGSNEGGLEFDFQKGQNSVIPVSVTARPFGDRGSLIRITEDKVNSTATTLKDFNLTTTSYTVAVGATATINTNSVDGCSFTSGDNLIATVDASGVITGVAPGNTNVVITKDGYNSRSVSVIVPKQDFNFTTTSYTVGMGSTETISTDSVTGCSFTSNDTDVCTVDASGVITPVAAGSTTITVTKTGYNDATLSVTVTS